MTPEQLATLKADILANPELDGEPMTSGGAYAIAAAYNTLTTTDVWSTKADVNAIYNAIDWSKYTPTDAADGTALFTNRLLMTQVKQMNLQNMLQGRTTVDGSKANIRASLRDAVIALPTGTSGAATTAAGASGVNVLNALLRKATRFEKLFATTQATTGSVTANVLTLEGNVSVGDIQTARELP